MSRDINPFGLRMPAELRDKLEAAAAESGRSMNSELVHRLQASFEPPPAAAAPEMKKLVEHMEAIRRKVERMPVHLIHRKDGSLEIYGYHSVAFTRLLDAGIEGEAKHDHHLVPKVHAAAAQRVLSEDPIIEVASVTDEKKMAAAREQLRLHKR